MKLMVSDVQHKDTANLHQGFFCLFWFFSAVLVGNVLVTFQCKILSVSFQLE